MSTPTLIQFRGARYRRVAAVPREKLLAVLESLEQTNQELVETLQLYSQGTPMYLELKQAIQDNEQHRAVVQRELEA